MVKDNRSPEPSEDCPSAKDCVHVQIAALARIIEERDRLYTERHLQNDKAVAAALEANELAAAKALTASNQAMSAALDSQKEAARKAEEAQKEYNQTHNDLLRRMDKQYEDTLPRREFVQIHSDLIARLEAETKNRQLEKEALSKEIADLREANSRYLGEQLAKKEEKVQGNWGVGVLIAIGIALIGWLITGVSLIMNHH